MAEQQDGGVSRRAVLAWAGLLGAGAVVGGEAAVRAGAVEALQTGAWPARGVNVNTSLPLYSETVALRARGLRELVPPGAARTLVPGSRVLRGATDLDALLVEEQEWLARAAPWTDVDGDGLLRDGLLDLRVLLEAGASVAGWSPSWRYVWPRDAAHVAVALAAAGFSIEAELHLEWLEDVQQEGEWFEARYDPGTRASPDSRARQLDGLGWALWATEQVDAVVPGAAERRALLVRRSLDVLSANLDARTGLPAVSPDYWERPERRVTLGTAGPVLVGLRAAQRLGTRAAVPDVAAQAEMLADRLETAVVDHFGPRRFQRYPRGGGHCASLAFLLPPYLEVAVPGADGAFDEARASMARPGGGLAPGAGWKEDGISWTPETAMFANAALATGRGDEAQQSIDWLHRHRTAAGSFPEKVRADGSPAAVAPLAWTAALVVIARSIEKAARHAPRGNG